MGSPKAPLLITGSSTAMHMQTENKNMHRFASAQKDLIISQKTEWQDKHGQYNNMCFHVESRIPCTDVHYKVRLWWCIINSDDHGEL
jgi:hypothetical protein